MTTIALKRYYETEMAETRKIGWMRIAISAAILLVLAVIWGLFINGSLRAMQVGSGSMQPTLQVGDKLIVSDIPEDEEIQRGEIVTLESPDDDGADLVKRVVAIPGDTVQFRRGYFMVNGKPAPPPGETISRASTFAVKDYVLKEDEYFVLGDNRLESHDSEEFGPVSRKMINGKVIYRYGPRERMGEVE